MLFRLKPSRLRLALSLGFAFALAAPAVGGAQDEDDAELEVRTQAALSGEAQVAEGERVARRGTQLSDRLSRLLDQARRESDIIRVTCLNDKLTQVNANGRTVERRLRALREASQMADNDRRNHEFTVMSVLAQKFDLLDQEANQCVGQDAFETGAAEVVTTVEDDVPDDDPRSTPAAPVQVPPVIVIPPPASPSI